MISTVRLLDVAICDVSWLSRGDLVYITDCQFRETASSYHLFTVEELIFSVNQKIIEGGAMIMDHIYDLHQLAHLLPHSRL